MIISKKHRAKRDYIVSVARDVFKKFGYKKTTMNDVAKAAGKGKSSIYYYFESKNAIFKTVILSEAIIYRNKVLDSISNADNPLEKLKSYIMIRLQTDRILSNFHRAINDPYLKHIKFVKKLKDLYDREEFSIFRSILEDGENKAYFEVYNIRHAAVGIVNAMRGIESTLLLNPEDPQLEAKVENILNIVLYGIVKR
ncbi:MAG: TetR/AcrR family transcriptional regulator [Bacteroidales bacterium]|nr:TetR/AcrR family transcriptional regulator [Bacteroidales bacterium]